MAGSRWPVLNVPGPDRPSRHFHFHHGIDVAGVKKKGQDQNDWLTAGNAIGLQLRPLLVTITTDTRSDIQEPEEFDTLAIVIFTRAITYQILISSWNGLNSGLHASCTSGSSSNV